MCRERKVGNQENTSWSPTYGNFTDPAALGALSLPPVPGPVALSIDSRGATAADFNDQGGNVFQARAENRGTQPAAVQLAVSVAGEAVTSSASVAAGRSSVLRLS